MTKIEELEQKLDNAVEKFRLEMNECKKELAELKESNKEGKWKPKDDEEYWFRDDEGDIVKSSMHREYDWNVWRENNFPIFKTKEQCERYWNFMDTVKEKSYEFNDLEWRNNDIDKWVIEYDYLTNQLRTIDHHYIKHFGLVYFKNEDDAKYIIDNFKEELLEYWL